MKIFREENIKHLWAHFLLGGSLYVLLEIIWRGYSHYSMFLAGGTAYILLIYLRRRFVSNAGWFVIMACVGAVVITAVELIYGVLFNIVLGLSVWDYAGFGLNFIGQISLTYSLLWIFVAMIAFVVDFGVSHIVSAVKSRRVKS